MTAALELVTRPVVIREDVIAILERWLEAAHAGELQAVALAGIEADGSAVHGFSDNDVGIAMAGAIARLSHRYHVNMDAQISENV